MDQLPGLDNITYSASLVLNRHVIAVTSGIVPWESITQSPCSLLLRVQHTSVPVHKPFVYPEREDKWLKMVEGPLHWTTLADEEGLSDQEKDDVFLSVRNLAAFVVTSLMDTHEERVAEIDNKLRYILANPAREPYAKEEVDGVLFEYYQFEVSNSDLGSTMVPTARLGQVSDLIRNDWLYRTHPVFFAKGDQPLITAALIAGYNKETDKGEIYLAVYRGHIPISTGGKLQFWGIDFTILDCGLLLRKNRVLTLLDYNFQDLTVMDLKQAVPIMEYPTKTGVKNFIAAAEESPLGTWHVSLQYNGTEWYRDKHAPEVDPALKERLLRELERFVAMEKMNNDVNDEQ